jgi:hypothetical protein
VIATNPAIQPAATTTPRPPEVRARAERLAQLVEDEDLLRRSRAVWRASPEETRREGLFSSLLPEHAQ